MGKDVIKIANEMNIVVDDCSCILDALENIRATAYAPGQHGLMLTGEVGTGKSTVANLFHRCSPVHEGKEPFVSRDCATIRAELADSDLFGHVHGAFTGASRNRDGLLETVQGGTLFLDEIGHLPPEVRNKLFMVMSEGIFFPVGSEEARKFRGKIVVAMSQQPHKLLETGVLTEAFLSRIGAVVSLPPLRDRTRAFSEAVIRQQAESVRGKILGDAEVLLTSEAQSALIDAHYPDNVRGLITTFHLALGIVLSRIEDDCTASVQVEEEHVCEARHNNALLSAMYESAIEVPYASGGAIMVSLGAEGGWAKTGEKQIIEHTLRVTGGRVVEAAKRLGICRETLGSRIKQYQIDVSVFRGDRVG